MLASALMGLNYLRGLDLNRLDISYVETAYEVENSEFKQFTQQFNPVTLPYNIPREEVNPQELTPIRVEKLEEFVGNAPIIVPIENEALATHFGELTQRIDIAAIAAYDLKPAENQNFTAVIIKFISDKSFQDYVCTFTPDGKIISCLEVAGMFGGDVLKQSIRKAIIQPDFTIDINQGYVSQLDDGVTKTLNKKHFRYKILSDGQIVKREPTLSVTNRNLVFRE